MIASNKIKTVAAVVLLATALSFMAGCKDKTTIKGDDTAIQTGQSNTSTEENQQGGSGDTKEITIDEWKFNVPEGYELEETNGPWYEKKYANDKGIVLLFGYYEPNGIDNRNDKQIFNEQTANEEQDLINRYGSGEVSYRDINSDRMYVTMYYETRDLKVLKRSIIKDRIWKTVIIEIPISENEKDYESILDIIK